MNANENSAEQAPILPRQWRRLQSFPYTDAEWQRTRGSRASIHQSDGTQNDDDVEYSQSFNYGTSYELDAHYTNTDVESQEAYLHCAKAMRRQQSDPVTDSEKTAAWRMFRRSTGGGANYPSALLKYLRNEASQRLRDMHLTAIMSSSALLSSVEFYCGICLENHSSSDAFTFFECDSHHQYCKVCMHDYTASQVRDGVVDHFCPHEGCLAKALDVELEQLLGHDAVLVEKLRRFRLVRRNPNYRECSRCGRELHFNPTPSDNNNSSNISTTLTCECGAISCFSHGDAHPHETCQQYARRVRAIDQLSTRTVSNIARPCPSCRAATEKSGGCNHMTCRNCDTDWCWLCGRSITSTRAHFDALNIDGCPGAQFAAAPAFAAYSCFGECYATAVNDNRMLRYLVNAPYILLYMLCVLATLLLFSAVIVVAGVVFLATTPVTVPLYLTTQHCSSLRDLQCVRQNSETIENALFFALPLAAVSVLVVLCTTLVLFAWLPFALAGFLCVPFAPGSIYSCCSCYNNHHNNAGLLERVADSMELFAYPAILMVAVSHRFLDSFDTE